MASHSAAVFWASNQTASLAITLRPTAAQTSLQA